MAKVSTNEGKLKTLFHVANPFIAIAATPLVTSLIRAQPVSALKNLLLGVLAGQSATTRDAFDQKISLQGLGLRLLRASATPIRELKLTQARRQSERELLALLRVIERSWL